MAYEERKAENPGKKLSIVIPMYNAEGTLEKCLQSVNSAVKDIDAEVILIDDGSEDRTAAIAGTFAEENSRFRCCLTEHKGKAEALNKGISMAKGEFLGFVSARDLVKPGMFIKLLNMIESKSADMAVINVESFDTERKYASDLHSRVFGELYYKSTNIYKHRDFIYDTLIWNKLIRRSFWDRCKLDFPSGMIYAEMPVCLALHCNARAVAVVKEKGYSRRRRDEKNGSSAGQAEILHDAEQKFKALEKVSAYIEKEVNNNYNILAGLKNRILIFDFKNMMQQFKNMDDETAEKLRDMITSFLDRHISSEEDFYDLDRKDQQMYKALTHGNVGDIRMLLR